MSEHCGSAQQKHLLLASLKNEEGEKRIGKGRLADLITGKPSRELSVEETLSWTFSIYSRNFLTFFVPLLVSSVLGGVLSTVVVYYGFTLPQPLSYASPAETLNWLFAFLASLFLIVIVLGGLYLIIGALTEGICVRCTSELVEKGSTDLLSAFNFTIGKLVPLIAGSILAGFLIGLGIIVLIIPGIILAVMFFLVIPTIVVENLGPIGSLGRSRRLVDGRWLKTFVFLLIIGIILIAASYIIGLVVAPLGSLADLLSATPGFGLATVIAGTVIQAVAVSLIAPVVPISMTIYYYSMLAREQQRMPPLPPPPPVL